MPYYTIIFLVLLATHAYASGPSWPTVVSEKHKVTISSTFGESRVDHFHNGLDIPGENIRVFSVQAGKIIWIQSNQHRLNEPIPGGGKTVIIQHNKKFWSGYMHLNQVTLPHDAASYIKKNDKIGLSGKTGHSGGAHLHFFFFNPQTNQFQNPLLTYPKDLLEDKRPPIHTRMITKKHDTQNNRESYHQDQQNRIPQSLSLYMRFSDQGNQVTNRWGIYFMKVKENDKLVHEFTCDFLQFNGSRWLLNNKYSFEHIYSGLHYLVIKNPEKNSTIHWIVGGYTGPSSNGSYHYNQF